MRGRVGTRMCLGLMTLSLAACASSGLHVREYLLSPGSSESSSMAPRAAEGPVIQVIAVEVPDYLQRPEIVTRGPGGRLETRASECWGEDLGSGIARVLAADLGRLVPTGQVFVGDFPIALRPDYGVSVQIRRFEPVGGSVELDGHWALRQGTPGPSRLQPVSVREAIAEDTTEARVAAMSRAVEQLAADIASGIRETPPREAQGASRKASSASGP